MILTYYQAVELMTFLPVLLSSTDNKAAQANTEKEAIEENDTQVQEMWYYTDAAMEVNGAEMY